MTVQQTTLDNIKTEALAEFDDLIEMAFGTGTGAEDPSDTALGNEIERNVFDETPLKSIAAGTYDFSGLLGLSEGNGNTIAEVGLFNSSSGVTMKSRKLLTNTVAKTSNKDLSVGIRITVEVINA